ncbi:endonuclease YncB(thermonuclease family) [Pseudonocardia eucalypti]|uniref:thermonuclease family protein n=1 Tax=Pseudonocardia eucalypti TaxID=648755 RepID=UPI001621C6B8|nr:endonuclease YncB(thermonuclease family) [Pseudonocardia eucalypti]
MTNHRVLLLRDGRSGQASEGYPVERLSGADWTVDGITGTITIRDSNSVAELRDVPLADGADVVAVLRGFIARNAPRQLFGEEHSGLESGGFPVQAGGDPAGIPGQTRFPVHVTAGTAQQLSGLASQGGYPAQPASGSFPAQQPASGGLPGQPHGGFPAQQGQPGGEQPWSGAWAAQQPGGFSGQSNSDGFLAQPRSDAFAAQPQGDPFGAQPPGDPFAAQQNDPFAAQPQGDPFAAQPQSDPFGAQAPSGEFPAQQPASGNFPAQQPTSGGFPAQQPAGGNYPAQQPASGSYAAQQPASGSFPAQQPASGSFPAQQPTSGSFPAQQPASGNFPAQQPASGSFPTQQPVSGGFPAQQPASGNFPAQQPASGNFPVQQPASGGFPAQPQGGTQQPQSGGFPAQQPTSGNFPAQQPRFPGQQGQPGGGQPRGGFPAQQAGFPTQASTVGIPQAQGSAVFPVPTQAGGVEGLEQRVAAFGSAEALTAAAVPVTMLADSGTNQPQPVVLAPSAAPVPGAPLPPSAVSADAIGSPTAIAGEVPVSQLVTQRTDEPELKDDADAADRPKPITWRMPPAEAAGKGAAKEGKATESSTALLAATDKADKKDGDKAGNVTPLRPASKPSGRNTKKWIWLGAGAAGLIGLAAIGSAKLISTNSQPVAAPVSPAPAASIDQPVGTAATVTKVIDGETVEVAGPGVTGPVVVLGIVAPRADKNQCGATAAKAYAVKTLHNAQVTLVTDASQAATDKSGRKQAFVRLADGGDYSEMAVRAGMARYYESPQPVARAAEIKAAEEEAKSNKAGFWGTPCNGKLGGTGTGSNSRASTGGTQPPARTVSNVQESPR